MTLAMRVPLCSGDVGGSVRGPRAFIPGWSKPGYPGGFERVYRGVLAPRKRTLGSRNEQVMALTGTSGGKAAQRVAPEAPTLWLRGVAVHRGGLDGDAQAALMAEVQAIWEAAPPVRPVTRWGRQMSVAMTSAGRLGWVTDRRGYRYEPAAPDGRAWPPIAPALLALWRDVTGLAVLPDSCLVNLYRGDARMGLHQDRDEAELDWPVVSVSLGDKALFRVGSIERGGRTESLWLQSGDVVVMGGAARLVHHGIDRICAGSSALVPGGGRVNLTLRVAGPTGSGG